MRLPAKYIISAVMSASLMAVSNGAEAKQKVKIAWVGPLTGALSAYGLGGRNSAELAVQVMNANSEANYEYELVPLDDECKPNVGVQVVTKAAVDRSIIAAIPFYCSSTAMAAIDIFNRYKLPMVVWAAVLPDITYGNDYPEVNRVTGALTGQNKVGAKFMKDEGYKTFVSFADSTDFGKSNTKYFSLYTGEEGGQILASFSVPPDQQDLSAELTKVKELNPEVVYFGGLVPLGARLRTQMEKLGIKAQFEGTSAIMGDAYVNAVGPDLAEGTIAFYDSPQLSQTAGGKFFLEKYQASGFKEAPEAYGHFSYAATMLVLEAIEKVGPTRAAVTAELGKTKDHPSIVGPITFDDHGQNVTLQTTKYIVQDGKWVVWEDSEYASGKRKLKKLQ
ncbi:branched-chain amino acid ABC transporter substrate-binding protein [Rhizobium binxianense]|uniref:branched-chain amino acid ABC transporter substrate-binding protein n=1 Tax=Rhizobium binxianense TaxID=3024242 RepID=UPI00235FEA84|nr:branched-chain amino acid ABC transporter substrate-binding protein [Rhizobium sp. MJ37]MDC9837803.1 branched-chain amino acid ABC transporter substrate-binding protein [Rhizobium sp. MJ37]